MSTDVPSVFGFNAHDYRAVATVVLVATLVLVQRAQAGTSASVFDVAPPGTIVRQQNVYLRGEAMNSRYIAVASRVVLAPANNRGGVVQYQPYLSIYAPHGDNTQFRLVYRSPGPADTLRLVPRSIRPDGSPLFFPTTSLTLIGAAEFMQPTVQQLVVSVHAFAADCGATNVYVLGMDTSGHLAKRAAFRNYCALAARIQRGAPDTPASLLLTGPYYARGAPLCCPTKPRASSVVTWASGRWTARPPYFTVLEGEKPSPP